MKIVKACEKCGNLQKRNEEKSTENWDVFDSKEKCTCGGKFIFMFESDLKKFKRG